MNLIPEYNGWYSFYPKNLPSPEFVVQNGLRIVLPKNEYSLGKWICDIPIFANKTFNLKAKAITCATKHNAWVIFSTHKADGSMEVREHTLNCTGGDGFLEFSHTFKTGNDIVSLKVELWLKGVGGSACWQDIILTERAEQAARMVNVCSTYINPFITNPSSLELNLQNILAALDNAKKYSPDIILLSEGMYHCCAKSQMEEALNNTTFVCELIAKKAKELAAYVIFNMAEKQGELLYNTSLVFDRKGEVVFKYRKTHLTVRELEAGYVPGTQLGIYETDFGKIGLLTCWDQYFPETAIPLVDAGAEIIFVPTMGEGGVKSFARAVDNGVYFVTSGVNGMINGEDDYGWAPSKIISPLGNLLSQTGTHLESAHSTIDLNQPERAFWLSVGPAATDSKGCYKFEKNK